MKTPRTRSLSITDITISGPEIAISARDLAMLARIHDPQTFDDAFLAAQIEAVEDRIIGTMKEHLDQTIMDAISPSKPLIA